MSYDPIEYFTEGWCHRLALAIRRLTKWPIYLCVNDGYPEHAVVRMPDGRWLDVRGPQTTEQLAVYWPRTGLQAAEDETFEEWDDGDARLAIRRATRLARRLIDGIQGHQGRLKLEPNL